jgi:hypothetical protein
MQDRYGCPSDLREQNMSPDFQKASAQKAVKSGKETAHMAGTSQDRQKKHLLLNHPLWLVVNSLIALSPGQDYSEILCKRMSWIVAQTIAKQLPSVVKTSI